MAKQPIFTMPQLEALISTAHDRIAKLEMRVAELEGADLISERTFSDPDRAWTQPRFTFSDPVPPLSDEDKAFIRGAGRDDRAGVQDDAGVSSDG